MNPSLPKTLQFAPARLPPLKWDTVMKQTLSAEGCSLMTKLVCYKPEARVSALQALSHEFFDSLRQEEKPLTRQLFNFQEEELLWCPQAEIHRLMPKWTNNA